MLVAQNSLGPVCPVPLTVRGIAAAARARIWDERRSAAAARDASRLRRQRMKARVRAFVLFERRQLTKFTRAESCRVLDMDFFEDGIFVA